MLSYPVLTQDLCTNFDWDNLVKDDINETCRLFTDKILLSSGEFILHKLATVRTYHKPFYNGYLRRLRRKVNRLHHKAKNTNTVASWDYLIDMKESFTFERLLVVRMIIKTKFIKNLMKIRMVMVHFLH